MPGQRTFYLQVRTGKLIVCIALEKQQAAQLAEKIDEVLDQLLTVDGNPFHVPTSTFLELVDNDDLEPVEEQFRTGVMSLGWDPTTAQIVIEAYPLAEVEEDDESDDAEEVLRVKMPVGTARGLRQAHPGDRGRRAADLRDLRPADRRRRAHLHLPRCLMPAPDLVTAELTLTGRITTASNATFLGSIGDAAVV